MFKMGCSMARKILAIDGKNSSSAGAANDPTLASSSSSGAAAAAAAATATPSRANKGENATEKSRNNQASPHSKSGKNNAEEINDFSKLQDDPRIPLNVRQIFKITKSWKAIARTMSKTGTAMFLNLFEQNQDLFYLFVRFQHLKGKELHDSMELREHAATVMSTLDQSISALSDYDNFVNYLHSIGKLHRKVPGFKREHFWKIEQPFLKAVKQTLDERCNETIEEIYKIAIKLIIETIAEGYGQDDAAAASSGPASTSPPASGAAGRDTSAQSDNGAARGNSSGSPASSSAGARTSAPTNGASDGRQTKRDANNLSACSLSPSPGERLNSDHRHHETMILWPDSPAQPLTASAAPESEANALAGSHNNSPLMKCAHEQPASASKQQRTWPTHFCISADLFGHSEISCGTQMETSKEMQVLVANKQQQEQQAASKEPPSQTTQMETPNPSNGLRTTLFALRALLPLMAAPKEAKGRPADRKQAGPGEPSSSCPAAAGNQTDAIKCLAEGCKVMRPQLFGLKRKAALQHRLASTCGPVKCSLEKSSLCGNSNSNSNTNKLKGNHDNIGRYNNNNNNDNNDNMLKKCLNRTQVNKLEGEREMRSPARSGRESSEGEVGKAGGNAKLPGEAGSAHNARQVDWWAPKGCGRRKSANEKESSEDLRDRRGGGCDCGKVCQRDRPIERRFEPGENEMQLSASFAGKWPTTDTSSSRGFLMDEQAKGIVLSLTQTNNNNIVVVHNNNNNNNNSNSNNDVKEEANGAARATVRDRARTRRGGDSDCMITSEELPNGSSPANQKANCGPTIGLGGNCAGRRCVASKEGASFQCRHLTCPPRSSNDDSDNIEHESKLAQVGQQELTISDSSRAGIVRSDCTATFTMESPGEQRKAAAATAYGNSAKLDKVRSDSARRRQSNANGGPKRRRGRRRAKAKAMGWLKQVLKLKPNSQPRSGQARSTSNENENKNKANKNNSQQLKFTNELSNGRSCCKGCDCCYRYESPKATLNGANQLERKRPEAEAEPPRGGEEEAKKTMRSSPAEASASPARSIPPISFESWLSSNPADLAELIKLLLLTLAAPKNPQKPIEDDQCKGAEKVLGPLEGDIVIAS